MNPVRALPLASTPRDARLRPAHDATGTFTDHFPSIARVRVTRPPDLTPLHWFSTGLVDAAFTWVHAVVHALVTADLGLSVPTVRVLMGIAVHDRWKKGAMYTSQTNWSSRRLDLHLKTEQYSYSSSRRTAIITTCYSYNRQVLHRMDRNSAKLPRSRIDFHF
jgi:hypothetical protein